MADEPDFRGQRWKIVRNSKNASIWCMVDFDKNCKNKKIDAKNRKSFYYSP